MMVLISIFQSKEPYKFPLECLDFKQGSFGNAKFKVLLTFLKSQKMLKKLNLAFNRLDDEVSEMLAEVFIQKLCGGIKYLTQCIHSYGDKSNFFVQGFLSILAP